MAEPRLLGLDPRPEPEPPCRGWCRGERSTLDAPSKVVEHNGRRLLVCQCCGYAMTASPVDMTDKIAAGRLDPSVKLANALLFSCDYCKYDTILGTEIIAS